jgi:NHL repeat
MKIKIIIALFIILPFFFVSAQSFTYYTSIGDFESASSFYINSTGIIFVTDISKDNVVQLDTLGNIIYKIGGYGWQESTFDNPVDVFADALKVFVADKNNHRIQQFDKNLNFILEIKTKDSDNENEQFGYPLSAVMSNQGDIFILDSENSRIVKFDIFGNFIQNFGGYDYGNYSLQNPKQLSVSMNNNLFVIDGNEIIIFDQYGNGIGKTIVNETINSIRIIFNQMVITTKNKIFLSSLKTSPFKLNEIKLDGLEVVPEIVSTLIFKEKLYLLTKKNILIFNEN